MPVNLSEFGQPWDGRDKALERKKPALLRARSAGSGCRSARAGGSRLAHAIVVPIAPAPAAAVGPGRSGIAVIGWAVAVRRIVAVGVIGIAGIIAAVIPVGVWACERAANDGTRSEGADGWAPPAGICRGRRRHRGEGQCSRRSESGESLLHGVTSL